MYKSRKLPVIRISISTLECKYIIPQPKLHDWVRLASSIIRTTRNDKFFVELLDNKTFDCRGRKWHYYIIAMGEIRHVITCRLYFYTQRFGLCCNSIFTIKRTYIHKAPYRLIKRQPALDRCVHINYFNLSFLSFTIFCIFSSFIEQV